MTQMSWLNGAAADFTASAAAPTSGFSLNVATGQDPSGAIQTAGDLPDANWTVTNADNYKNAPIAYTVAPGEADCGYPWLTNGPNSSWIAADPNVRDNGNMTFTFKFDLTGYNPADATLVGGAFSADDLGTVYLNGNSLGSQTTGGWTVLNALSNGAGDFVAGVNTLVIQVTHADGINEAARLEGTIVDTVTTNPPGPVHWVNPVSDSFDNAADWSGGFVPGAANDAILDAPGITLYTVTASSNEAVNSLQTAANATLAVTGGTFATNFTATNGTGGGLNAGVISVSNSAALTMGGAIDNAGSINVTGAERGTALVFGMGSSINPSGSATLTGSGNVTFLPNSTYSFAFISGGTLTNVDNTILGDFAGIQLTELVNESAGVIDAITTVNPSTPHSTIFAETINNAGVIESTGPSPLVIASFGTLDNTGGVISAGDGSSLEIAGGTLVGGTLETSGTGVIYIYDVIFDGANAPVNNIGALAVNDRDRLILDGTINNAGSISLSTASHITSVEVGASNAVLTGGGKVILGDNHLSALTGAVAGAALTNSTTRSQVRERSGPMGPEASRSLSSTRSPASSMRTARARFFSTPGRTPSSTPA